MVRFSFTAVALATFCVLTGCGTVPAELHNAAAAKVGSGCLTIVHGVVSGRGSLAPGWLPRGFRPLTGYQPAASLPQASFAEVSTHPDPPRIMLGSAIQPGPLTAAQGGRVNGMPVEVQGHRGFLESGPPDPQFIGVYWKPAGKYVISVVGYKVSASVVLRVARKLAFDSPGVAELPVRPGPIVSRQAAIKAAERAVSARPRSAVAKLSSWTEIQALAMHASTTSVAPAGLADSPSRPVWAVLPTGSSSVEIVGAASGQAELSLGDRGSWFAALTDRDPASAKECPGGSSALVPFGVLTRDEQAFTASWPVAGGVRTSVRLVLSTVPAVNRADRGLFGGCVQQNCSIDQLVWVTITTVRAAPGKTIACLPGDISVPPGYKPNRVKQYYSVDVPGNVGIGCSQEPSALRRLKDLAPPLGRASG
jgi:hypothetical protein